MSGRKLSFLAASIAITLLASTVGISAAASAPTDPGVEAQMGAPVTNAADCLSKPIADYNIGADPYGLHGIAKEIGAEAYYRDGFFGQGVDVALIDSGVGEVPGMNDGNLVHGPDLSFESQAPHADDEDKANPDLAYRDTYGHGTHMAGIIAGRDKAAPSNWKQFNWEDPTAFRGIAPGSRVVSVKVADALGAVDVTQIIAAIDWVVQNKKSNGLNIRVINLSLGIYDAAKYQGNALSHSVEQAWTNGIVVVAAAGNGGRVTGPFSEGALPAPASGPSAVVVGSYDTKGTLGSNQHEDDTSSSFTQQASSERTVDITAPGEHVMSLHVPGSHADAQIERDCRDGIAANGSWTSPIAGPDERFVRGSGTSQSAAVVSGAVALVLSKAQATKDDLDPTAVRRLLMTKARPLCWDHDRKSDGLGELNLSNDDKCIKQNVRNPKPVKLTDKFKDKPPSKGGSLQQARGNDTLPCMTWKSISANRGTAVRGAMPRRYEGGLCSAVYSKQFAPGGVRPADLAEVDVHGYKIKTTGAGGLAEREKARNTWTVDAQGDWHWMDGPAWFSSAITVAGRPQWPTKQWNTDWTGVRWSSGDWAGTRWSGTRWSGTRWSADDWQGTRWSGTRWSEASWSGVRWSGDKYQGTRWSGTRWSGTRWSDAIFRDHAWR